MNNLRTVFVTKYALTMGIIKMEAELKPTNHGAGKVVYAYGRLTAKHMRQCYSGSDYHLTWENAVKDAKSRQAKKIASLRKQMFKIQDLEFAVPPLDASLLSSTLSPE